MRKGIDTDFHLMVVTFLLLFTLGFALFEFGSVRRKNSDSMTIKYLPVFASTGILVFIFGYAFVYGSPYFLGKDYFFSDFKFEEDNQDHQKQWALLFAGFSMASSLAIAGVAERAKLLVPFAFSILLAFIMFPMVSAWTFGGGYLHQLGYQDYGNCGAFHLAAGFSAFVGSALIGPRLGRYKALV